MTQPSRWDTELRVGIESLDVLLATRAELVKQVAPLRARYASFGTWDAIRKIELARVAQLIRAEALASEPPRKLTEAAIEDLSHADGRYADQVIRATEERAKWAELEDQIDAVNDRIARDNALCRFVTQEVALSR